MNLRDLEYIVTTAKLGSMGRAAAACHVSQSTLSIQLKKVEGILGVQIFERNNRRVIPTPIGEKIIQIANSIIRQAAEIKALATESKDPLAGEMRLGAFPTLAPYWFPLIIPSVKKKFPNLKIQLIEEKTQILIEKLRDGEIDCAALALPINDPEFESRELFTEPFYLALPHQHKLAKRKNIKNDDLIGDSLLLLEEGHCMRGQALQFCAHQGISESGSYRASSLETLRNMVIAGQGITIIPKLAIRPKDANLLYIPFSQNGPERIIGLFWRKTSARAALYMDLAQLFVIKN